MGNFVKAIPLSLLNRRPGEIVDLALAAPVVLTKHGRRQLVMMSAETYDRLMSAAGEDTVGAAAGRTTEGTAPGFLARQAAKAIARGDD